MGKPADATNPMTKIDAIIAQRDAEIASLKAQVADLWAQLAERDAEYGKLQAQVAELTAWKDAAVRLARNRWYPPDEERSPINIHPNVKSDLVVYLYSQSPSGEGYSEFIKRALDMRKMIEADTIAKQ